MNTRANVIVFEKNGDWENTIQFYRHLDGHVAETGKNLMILAYMAKEYAYPDVITDDAGNATRRDNFKRIRNRFIGYLNDSGKYEAEEFVDLPDDVEYVYLVKIERADDESVKITVKYVETDSGYEKGKAQLLSGWGTEIVLFAKEIK